MGIEARFETIIRNGPIQRVLTSGNPYDGRIPDGHLLDIAIAAIQIAYAEAVDAVPGAVNSRSINGVGSFALVLSIASQPLDGPTLVMKAGKSTGHEHYARTMALASRRLGVHATRAIAKQPLLSKSSTDCLVGGYVYADTVDGVTFPVLFCGVSGFAPALSEEVAMRFCLLFAQAINMTFSGRPYVELGRVIPETWPVYWRPSTYPTISPEC